MHLCHLIYIYIDPLDNSIDQAERQAIETHVKDVTLSFAFSYT